MEQRIIKLERENVMLRSVREGCLPWCRTDLQIVGWRKEASS